MKRETQNVNLTPPPATGLERDRCGVRRLSFLMEELSVPIIQITPQEELKVFWELKEAGPMTRFYPGDILIVQKAHLKVLDDAGVQYIKKERDAIRQSHIAWEEQKKRKQAGLLS